jgi:hypothetical protein
VAASYFRLGPCSEGCSFCHGQGHRIHECPIGDDYVRSGHATIINGRIHLPNGQPIPFDGTRRGLKASIDSWLAVQAAPMPTMAQTCVVFIQEPPPHTSPCATSTSQIEEVVETHILQIKEAAPADNEEEPFPHDIFEVFTAEKKKREDKAPELSAPPPTTPTPAAAPSMTRPNTQYCYQSNAEDQCLISKLEGYLMQGKLSLTTPAHIFAASLAIHKDIVNKLKLHCIETNEYEALSAHAMLPFALHATVHDDFSDDRLPGPLLLLFCLPLQEIDVLINRGTKISAIYDTSSQIIAIQ